MKCHSGLVRYSYVVLLVSLLVRRTHTASAPVLNEEDRETSFSKVVDRADRTDVAINKTWKNQERIDHRIEKYIAQELRDELNSFESEGVREGADRGRVFNKSVAQSDAVLETVAHIKHHHHHAHNSSAVPHAAEDKAAKEAGARAQDIAIAIDEPEEEEEVGRLIDAEDNEYVMTKPHSGIGQMELQEDFTLISDLVVVIVAAAIGGLLFGVLGQPVILGYLVAGSIIGAGGLGLIEELIQVETLAQFGVVFLIFVLGVEFNAAKVNRVKEVAVGGGALSILLAMLVGVAGSFLMAVPARQGLFVGALVSMSSTAVVLKCLQDNSTLHSVPGQVMMGMLVFQDMVLGLLLAVLPNFAVAGYSTAMLLLKLGRELALLALFAGAAWVVSKLGMPRLLRLLSRMSMNGGEELFLLGVIAICLSTALLSQCMGLSVEVGAFVAGLMLSGPDYSERALSQVEPVRNFFASLFLSSVGMLMHPMFLWHHLDVLLACLVLLFTLKAVLTAGIVRGFGYHPQTAIAVGVGLAQVGEFAFVLLSRAKTLGLVPRTLYLILLGTTALSLCFTPFAFRWMCKLFPFPAEEPSVELSIPMSPPPSEISPGVSLSTTGGQEPASGSLRQRGTVHELTELPRVGIVKVK